MERLFKLPENILLYSVAGLYLIFSTFFSGEMVSSEAFFVLYKAAVLLLALLMIREFIMTKRLEKMNVMRFKEVNRRWFTIRWFVVLIFMIALWFLSRTEYGTIIVAAGAIFNGVMPSPIFEGVYLSKEGIVIKGVYYALESIDKIKLYDSGDLAIFYNKKEIRVAHHSKDEKKEIFKYLNRYITA